MQHILTTSRRLQQHRPLKRVTHLECSLQIRLSCIRILGNDEDSEGEEDADDALDEDSDEQSVVEEEEETILPHGEKLTTQQSSLSEVQARIAETTRILANFKNLKTKRTRSELMQKLNEDLRTYYGYSELMVEKFLDMFSVAEVINFVTVSNHMLKVRI